MEANTVIGGDYQGVLMGVKRIDSALNFLELTDRRTSVMIGKSDVINWAVLDGQERTSAGSAIARGAVGAFALGGLGMIAGALSAKKKGTYTVGIEYKHKGSKKKSILYVDEKTYRHIASKMF